MRQEARRLEGDLARREGELRELQAAHDDVLERLKCQSSQLLSALGGSGSGDDSALAQVRIAYVVGRAAVLWPM